MPAGTFLDIAGICFVSAFSERLANFLGFFACYKDFHFICMFRFSPNSAPGTFSPF